MYRFACEILKKWAEKNHPKPLVIRGARQVGKSTLVRLFCEQFDYDLIEINLENIKLREINNEVSFSIKKVMDEIEIVTQKKVTEKSLIFLDEIQNQPLAFSKLRYFYEDMPGLRVVAAGSLLDVILEEENFSMPVGRIEYLYLGPLSFREFLMAKGEDLLLEKMSEISLDSSLPQAFHERSMDVLKEYYFIGGMPEAVKEFVSSRDLTRVREIQSALLQTYRDDIPKYTKNKQGVRVREVFDYVPAHLGDGKVKFNSIVETNSALVREAINILDKAQVIIKVNHNTSSGIPLSVGADPSVMKLYFLDIGLYNAATDIQWRELASADEVTLLTKGAMAEQFIAQHLKFFSPNTKDNLYYWLRDGKKEAAEVDFIIPHSGRILPIEVKSGSTGKMRSLWQFVAEKQVNLALRFDLKHREHFLSEVSQQVMTSSGSKNINCRLLSLPLYTIELLPKITSAL